MGVVIFVIATWYHGYYVGIKSSERTHLSPNNTEPHIRSSKLDNRASRIGSFSARSNTLGQPLSSAVRTMAESSNQEGTQSPVDVMGEIASFEVKAAQSGLEGFIGVRTGIVHKRAELVYAVRNTVWSVNLGEGAECNDITMRCSLNYICKYSTTVQKHVCVRKERDDDDDNEADD